MTAVNAQIMVEFPEKDGYPSFRDAIYLPMNEYQRLSVSQVEALKQKRYDNFKATLDNQPIVEPVPVPEEQPPSSVAQARQILNDALARLDALPENARADRE